QGNPCPVDSRQLNHTQLCRERRIRYPGADHHDSERCQCHMKGCSASDKRYSACPDNMDNQCLCQKRFHKPARLKKLLEAGFLMRTCGQGEIRTAMEKKPHNRKCSIVEY